RDVHHGQAFTDGEGDGLFREFEELVERPVFRIEAHGRRADEGTGFDWDSDALRDLGYRLNVVAVRARGAVWTNTQFLVGDLARETFDARRVRAACARQTNVRRVNAERVHQVQEFDLLLDRRLADRRRLQPVTQGLV